MSSGSRRHSGNFPVVSLDEMASRFLMDASGALLGHAHVDSLAHAVVAAAVPALADAAVLDLQDPMGRTWRVVGGTGDPSLDDARGEVIRILLPSPDVPGSAVRAVLGQARVQMRGELGDSARDQDTYSLLSLPVLSDEVVLGALSLITFRRHDRYGRAELAVLEEYAARAGRAIRIVLDLEQLRRDAREAISHREIQHDTIRALEGGVAALRDEVRLLRAENAALRAPRDEQGNGATGQAADALATIATEERPSPPDRASAPDRPVVATAVAEAAAPAARQLRSTLRRTPKSAPVVPAPV